MNPKETFPNKEAEEFIKMIRNDKFQSRSEILNEFMSQGYLAYINIYFILAQDFIQHCLLKSQKFNDLNQYPYECLIFSQTMRIRRYVKGLGHLSFMKKEGVMNHCTDSYFPILKSIFELFVENRLTNSYINDFGKSDEIKKDLVNRILDYSNIARKKNNYNFNYIESFSNIPKDLMPKNIETFLNQGCEQHKEELAKIAKRLGYGKFTDVKHWYPKKDKTNKPIIKNKRRDFGSMRWRCQDVLGKYLPTHEERSHWDMSYNTLYELLNRYSHPVLGYDDNFRPNIERMYDLFQTVCPIIIILERYVFPSVIKDLDFQVKLNEKAKETYEKMEELKNIFLPFYMTASMVVNMENFTNN